MHHPHLAKVGDSSRRLETNVIHELNLVKHVHTYQTGSPRFPRQLLWLLPARAGASSAMEAQRAVQPTDTTL